MLESVSRRGVKTPHAISVNFSKAVSFRKAAAIGSIRLLINISLHSEKSCFSGNGEAKNPPFSFQRPLSSHFAKNEPLVILGL